MGDNSHSTNKYNPEVSTKAMVTNNNSMNTVFGPLSIGKDVITPLYTSVNGNNIHDRNTNSGRINPASGITGSQVCNPTKLDSNRDLRSQVVNPSNYEMRAGTHPQQNPKDSNYEIGPKILSSYEVERSSTQSGIKDSTADLRSNYKMGGKLPFSHEGNDNRSDLKTEPINNDHSLLSDIGYSFSISDTLLGHGSYGDVFLATDENTKQVAVKCCDIDDKGIPNILETSIMGSMLHPYLNRALRIQASDTKLYIIQELAQIDLAQHTRRDKGNHKPTMDELKHWCYCLAQAVAALHTDSIIHADIKASNVLLYPDGSIRLTDFTLSTKKWVPDEKFTHNVCTCTHRPLECLMRRSWDESLDIWSLGCTFYEIAYGELLFPYQGSLEPEQTKKDKDAKLRLRNRSVNAIIDWSSRGPNPPTSYEIIGTTQFPIDYIPFVLCDDFKKPEMAMFNDLMCKMLTVDPIKRPTIDQVLAHPFFQGMKPPVYLSIRRPINKISVTEQARVSRYLQRYTNNEIIQNLALNIYCRCNDLHTISEHVRAAVCTWIASKIIVGYPPTISLPPNQILSAEREICHNLLFRLHSM